MAFQHPYQCLQHLKIGDRHILLAAAGPHIYSFDLQDGTLLSQWPLKPSHEQQKSQSSKRPSVDKEASENGEPPGKRRRLSSPDLEVGSESSAEIVVDRPHGRRRKRLPSSTPNVSHIVATHDGKNLIAVTAEDKCIRVFDVGPAGHLRTLSERCMPKRLCAIVLAQDDTIICGDKFGDVYSLPIHPSPVSESAPVTWPGKKQSPPKPFKPSASDLTVHTKGNRQALQQQLRSTTTKDSDKARPSFEHKLLLGHVSLLTDLLYIINTSVFNRDSKKPSRPYILTSDRDEHIRISRGPPQTHIIHTYCLGHTEFVSKICGAYFEVSLLVSGGGDDFLLVWDWPNGRQVGKVELGKYVRELSSSVESEDRNTRSPTEAESVKHSQEIAVSGIWCLTYRVTSGFDVIIVACEGIPALFCYTLRSIGQMEYSQTIQLSGNALDVTVLQHMDTIIVSTDNVHKPDSTRTTRSVPITGEILVQAFTPRTSAEDELATWHEVPKWQRALEPVMEAINRAGSFEISTESSAPDSKSKQHSLGELLYALENLRKRVQGEDEGNT